MRIMADGTSFAHRLVLEDKRTSHFFVALEAFFVLAEKHYHAGGANVFAVHIMTVGAGHSSFGDRVMVLEHKLAFNIQVAVKACLGI